MLKFIKIQKIGDFVSRLSKKEKFLLYGAVFVVSVVLLDRLVVGPIFSRINLLNKEIIEKQKGLKNATHIITQSERIAQLKKKYASYLSLAKNEDEEIVLLLKEVENLANRNSIYLVDLKPAGQVKEGQAYLKYMVSLTCEADMEKMVGFIYGVESSERFLSIEKYQISPKGKDSSTAQCTMLISKVAIP